MQYIPARLIRACVAHLIEHVPTKRDLAQMRHIESAGAELIVRRGPFTLGINRFAQEIGVSPHTLGRLYLDLQHLLGEILRGHMAALAAELNTIPENSPNRPALCRAAYHRLIRGPDGTLTNPHLILTRYLYSLPPDELEPTLARRAELNALLGAGDIGEQAAILLDSGRATLDRIERMLLVLTEHAKRDEAAEPEPPQAANQNQPSRAAPCQTQAAPQENPCPGLARPPGAILH